MDLRLRGKKCWICKFCAIKQPPQNKHFVDAGLSNAIGHLYTSHHLKAPVGQRQSREEIREEEKMSRRRRTLHTFLNLNDENADDVKMMHRIHTSFDRKHFQRLRAACPWDRCTSPLPGRQSVPRRWNGAPAIKSVVRFGCVSRYEIGRLAQALKRPIRTMPISALHASKGMFPWLNVPAR